MKKPEFANGEIYHIYNRGVEKRRIFTTDRDHRRFLHNLIEFNDEECALPSNVRLGERTPANAKCLEIESPNMERLGSKQVTIRLRKLFVEILAFCLMPNHFHLLVRQRRTDGVVRFMQKMGVGYTMYFNLKYKRVGPLFQGGFKAVHVSDEKHFLYLPTYIHANPLDLYEREWRIQRVKNPAAAFEFMRQYHWSSFRDYIGERGFPALTQREFLSEVLEGPKMYKRFVQQWLKMQDQLGPIHDLILE